MLITELFTALIILALLLIFTFFANKRIKENKTEKLFLYGFLIGLTGSLLAMIFIYFWLSKKISNKYHRKRFFKATLYGFFTSLILSAAIGLIIPNLSARVTFDGPGMEPTIKTGQTVRVKTYGSSSPKRGDIVEYRLTNLNYKKYVPSGKLIHRIIAIPGEKIVIQNNILTVFNSSHPSGFDPDTNYISPSVVTSGNVNITLPPNMYFVMGDNRPDSLDSRTLGPISLKDIIGKVSLQ